MKIPTLSDHPLLIGQILTRAKAREQRRRASWWFRFDCWLQGIEIEN